MPIRRRPWMLSPLGGRLVSPDTGRADGEGKRGEGDGWRAAVVPSMPAQGAGMASSTNDSTSWTTTPSTHQLRGVFVSVSVLVPPCPPSSAPLDISSLRLGALVARAYYGLSLSLSPTLSILLPLHRRRPSCPGTPHLLSGRSWGTSVSAGGFWTKPRLVMRAICDAETRIGCCWFAAVSVRYYWHRCFTRVQSIMGMDHWQGSAPLTSRRHEIHHYLPTYPPTYPFEDPGLADEVNCRQRQQAFGRQGVPSLSRPPRTAAAVLRQQAWLRCREPPVWLRLFLSPAASHGLTGCPLSTLHRPTRPYQMSACQMVEAHLVSLLAPPASEAQVDSRAASPDLALPCLCPPQPTHRLHPVSMPPINLPMRGTLLGIAHPY